MSLDPEALRQLRDELGSVEPGVRAAALARLEVVIGESAREIIAEALVSENPEVRARAELLIARLDSSN